MERTVDSIIGQTFSDFEFIIFDDASTDDTSERLRKLADRYGDSRLQYIIHNENLGFVQGLVNAISVSTGEYIAIQGSGDASLPHRLARQVDLLDSRPEVAAVGGWYYNVEEGLGVRRLRQPNADVADYKDLLKVNVFSHGEVMFRRSIYDKVGGYRTEFRNSQDLDLWLRMSKIARFATVREPVYERYIQSDGVSYAPGKIYTQSLYSAAAQYLAQMEPEAEEAALAVLREQGPRAIVPVRNAETQRILTKAVLRLIFFGSSRRAIELAEEASHPKARRVALIWLARVYASELFAPLHSLVARALGIHSGNRV